MVMAGCVHTRDEQEDAGNKLLQEVVRGKRGEGLKEDPQI